MRASTSVTSQPPDQNHFSHQSFLARARTAGTSSVLKRRTSSGTPVTASPVVTHSYSMATSVRDDHSSSPASQHRHSILAIRPMELTTKKPTSPQPRSNSNGSSSKDISARSNQQRIHRSLQATAAQQTQLPTPPSSFSDPDLVFPVLKLPHPHHEQSAQQQDMHDDEQEERQVAEVESQLKAEHASADELAPAQYDDASTRSNSRDVTPDDDFDRRTRDTSPTEDEDCLISYSREVSPEIPFSRENSLPLVDQETDFLRRISPNYFGSYTPEGGRTREPSAEAAPPSAPAVEPQKHPVPLDETAIYLRERPEREGSPSDSYDMLQSYQPLAPVDRMRMMMDAKRENRAAVEPFRPNAGLARAITTSFVGGYGVDQAGTIRAPRTSIPHSDPCAKGTSSTASLTRQNTSPSSSATDETVEDSGIPDFFAYEKPWGNNKELHKQLTFFDKYISGILSRHRSAVVSVFLFCAVFITVTFGALSINTISGYIWAPANTLILKPQRPAPSNVTAWGQPDFQKLTQIQLSFTYIVDSASGGSELGRSLKLSEMAVSDLGMVVKHSQLSCKVDLAARLNRYAADARNAVDLMLHFSSRVGGSMDSILSADTRSLENLRRLSADLQSRRIYSLVGVLRTVLPFTSNPALPAATQRELNFLFIAAAEKLESVLRELISLGRSIATVLDELSQQLRVIHEVITDELAITALPDSDPLLMQLWKRISGANQDRRNFRDNAALLKDVAIQQSMAKGYVEDALFNLLKMNAELEDVRHRVAEPMLAGDDSERPLEEHVEAMQRIVTILSEKRAERDVRVRLWNSVFREGELEEGLRGGDEEVIRKWGRIGVEH